MLKQKVKGIVKCKMCKTNYYKVNNKLKRTQHCMHIDCFEFATGELPYISQNSRRHFLLRVLCIFFFIEQSKDYIYK